MHDSPKIAITANIAWHLYNFRRGLIEALEDAGMSVVLLAAPDEYADRLARPYRPFLPLTALKRTGLNPIHDLELFRQIVRYYRELRIDGALHYTSKANIYGGLACQLLSIPSIHTINGLGGPFSGDRLIAPQVIKVLYRLALRKSDAVFFQNRHDLKFFCDRKMIRSQQGAIVDGSGVNTRELDPRNFRNLTRRDKRFTCLLFSRLSRTKGIFEFAKAAEILSERNHHFRFLLAGRTDSDDLAVSQETIRAWHEKGILEFVGNSDRIPELIAQSDIVVYPSYYMEGIPRALLEALAMGKPIITTDHVGCRETVNPGVNGILVAKRNPLELANAIEELAKMPTSALEDMGRQSRALAVRRFDERLVVKSYVDALHDAIPIRRHTEGVT